MKYYYDAVNELSIKVKNPVIYVFRMILNGLNRILIYDFR